MKTALFAALGALALGACENHSNASTSPENHVFTTIGDAAIPEHHTSIFLAFSNIDGSAQGYIEASRILDRIGAAPMNQETDKAKHWNNLAIEMDANITEKHPPFRGRVKGPAYREYELAAGQTDIIREVFYAAETAQLSVNTRQGTVTLEVKANGEEKSVCHIKADSKAASCSWTPIYTTPHEIALTNISGEDVFYVLVSN